ncbi:hypothetical protein BVX98_02820 [bacterium F11]|nr:hypothetical protein BVX98_02820 [bacterium F11]
MIGVLIVTHGQFGEDLLKTACAIMKETENVAALNLSRRLEFSTLRQRVVEEVNRLDRSSGVIVLTDTFGGTSYNTCIPLLKDFNLVLITGVNLPMLLSAFTNRKRLSLKDLARKISDDAKKTISIISES